MTTTEKDTRDKAGNSGSRCPFHKGEGAQHPFAFGATDILRLLAQEFLGMHRGNPAPTPDGYTAIPELKSSKRSLVWKLLENPVQALTLLRNENADIVQYRAPNNQLVVATCNPHVIRAVLLGTDRGTNESDTNNKSEFISDGGQYAFGKHNIISDSNQKWRQQRTSINQTFGRGVFDKPEKIAQMRSIIDSQVEKLRQRISASRHGFINIELQEELSNIALRVAIAMIFDKYDLPEHTIKELHTATRTILKGFPLEAATPFAVPHWLLSFFSPEHAAIERSEGFLRSFAEDLLKHEENQPSDPPTVLTRMVDALKTSSPLMNRDIVLNNIRVLLIAGHETSGNVLAYAFANLALQPELAASAAREASQPEWREANSLTDLRGALPYTRQVIEESLRLHPPFYVLLRRTTSDITVECPTGTFLIPKDTELILDVFSAQRNGTFWGEEKTGYAAELFAPDRWSPQNIAQHNLSTQELDLFSFGLGSRICLGLHMFWAEALPFVASFMDAFTFSPLFQDTEVGMNGDLSLQREGGYPTRVSLRDKASHRPG